MNDCLSFTMKQLTALLTFSVLVTSTALSQDDTAPEQEPVLDMAKLIRAQTFLEDGLHEQAHKLFLDLEETAPPDPRILVGLAKIQRTRGQYDDAVLKLVDASSLQEGNYEILCLLGESLYLQGQNAAYEGDYEAAGYALLDSRRMYEEAASVETDRPEPWLGASRAERQRGDPSEARRLISLAVEIDPKHAESLIEYASLQFPDIYVARQQGDEESAQASAAACQALYERALKSDPDNGYALNGLAWVAYQAGNNEDAINHFQRSLLANPTLDDSYNNLAALCSGSTAERKRHAELLDSVVSSARNYGEGKERQQGRAIAHYQRGLARASIRDAEGLNSDLTEAARLWPDLRVACGVQRARGLYRDNQYDAAATALLAVVRSDLDDVISIITADPSPRDVAMIVRSLADNRYQVNDQIAARDLFRVSAEVLADSSSDWNNYALLARDTGQFEESYAAYERALALDTTNPGLLNDTALLLHYHLRRDLDRAADLYGEAIVEGKRVLEDANSDSFAKEAARIAVRDATNNLALLKQGKTRRRK